MVRGAVAVDAGLIQVVPTVAVTSYQYVPVLRGALLVQVVVVKPVAAAV